MNVICYMSNGYPNLASTLQKLDAYIKGGCKVLEVDLPSPDPYFEGELIAGRMKAALQEESDYSKYLDNISLMRQRYPDLRIIFLLYENIFPIIGEDRIVEFCHANDIRDLIIVGHENKTLNQKLEANGLRISCYIRYHLPADEIANAKKSSGFVYLQAKPIGSPVNPQFVTLKDCVAELRRIGFDREIYCGVGVHQPEDVAMVREAGADGAFVGSTILKVDHDMQLLEETVRKFTAQES